MAAVDVRVAGAVMVAFDVGIGVRVGTIGSGVRVRLAVGVNTTTGFII